MTTREHLKAFHEQAATHHTAMAKSHKKIAGLFGKTGSDHDQTLCDEHKAMSESHAQSAEYHLSMCKAIGVEDLAKADQIVPDHVRGINTGAGFAGITPIPRAGAPTAPKAPDVPFEFEHLLKIEDDLRA